MFKNGQMEWARDNVNTFLITVRNPVARIVSTFNYHRHLTMKERHTEHHIRQRIVLLGLFPNIDTVANRLLAIRNRTKPSPCVALSKTILQGKGFETDHINHFYYNYQYYAIFSIDQRLEVPVVVVRTEHTWEDAHSLIQNRNKHLNDHIHNFNCPPVP